MLSDAALYLPLAWVPFVWVPLVEGVVVLAVIAEMTGVVAVQIGAKRQYPMGKSDRAFWFGALGLALGLGVPLCGKPMPHKLELALYGILALPVLGKVLLSRVLASGIRLNAHTGNVTGIPHVLTLPSILPFGS